MESILMGYNPSAQGSTFKGSSRSVATGYQNGSGATLPVSAPVAVNTSGQIIPVDVANEAVVKAFVGLTSLAIPSAASGLVVSGGRLENAQTGYSIGTPLWINFDGTLTNIQPDTSALGWTTGMFVFFVGIVVQNEFNSSLQDIQLFPELIGQL
jgi:hypothetical protein